MVERSRIGAQQITEAGSSLSPQISSVRTGLTTETLWEYLVLQVTSSGMVFPRVPRSSAYMLNRLGSEGWELVDVLPISRGGARTDRIVATLKRPRMDRMEPLERKGWLGQLFMDKQSSIIQHFEKELEAVQAGKSLIINLEGDLG